MVTKSMVRDPETVKIMDQLKIPFAPDKLHWRVGSTNKKAEERRTGNKSAPPTKGIALAYINARDCMKRLDDVVGPENWQREHPENGICRVGINIAGEWVWKTDVSGETKIEAEKGGASRAFCRACANWGIGRYLYYLTNTWCPLNQWGQIEKENLPRLPDWAKP